MLVRIGAAVFAVIQGLLLLRLALPFVDLPKALVPFAPPLVTITDLLIAPFEGISKPFNLHNIADTLPGGGSALGVNIDKVDPAILVAMVGWGVIAAVISLVLTVMSRSRA